ncbi:MAG TPA: alpha/beta hydrolase [Polyangia bacterium]|jgi:pimeloyl-ACP methyl ester carboxylesterase
MGAWERVTHSAASTGQLVATAAVAVARSAAAAYRAVDPDLRSHLAQLPALGLTSLAGRAAAPHALPDDGHRPVVCVPGLGGSPGNFLPLRLFLRLLGRRRTYAMAWPAGATLEDTARHLRDFIGEVVTVNDLGPDAQVDVLTHSMGGLVARLALEDEPTSARVATLLTMAAPHAGSHLARYGATDHSLHLRPDSVLLERLARQVPWRGPPAQPRLVALWSRADVIVLPATSARVEGAENVELEGFTHYSYLLHPAAWRVVARTLAAAS